MSEIEWINNEDEFINALVEIVELVDTDPEAILACPLTTPIKRLDETLAARQPNLASIT